MNNSSTRKLVLRVPSRTMQRLQRLLKHRRERGYADASIMDVVIDLIETEFERLQAVEGGGDK